MQKKIRKLFSLILCISFLFQQTSFAQIAVQLDVAGFLGRLHQAASVDKFRPLHLRYFSYDAQSEKLNLLMDKGDAKGLEGEQLRVQGEELFKYFLTGIRLPNDCFWVNLRPDSPEEIIDGYLEKTEIGHILLEADLQLKKDTASFTSPDNPTGKEYWNKLYQKATELFGQDNITIPTLTRPWIVPGEVILRYTDSSAYIYKANLKVMLEEDYLTHSNFQIKNLKQYEFKDQRSKALNEYSSQLIRELIIPQITKEVNTAKRYAPLRQVYYSLILAQWFKKHYPDMANPYGRMIDTKDLTGLESQGQWTKLAYFEGYKKSFSDGEYNAKEAVNTPFGQTIRSYFSGGAILSEAGTGPNVAAIPVGQHNPTNFKDAVSRSAFAGLEVSDGRISISPQASQGEPSEANRDVAADSRQWHGGPNIELTAGIRAALEQGNFAAVGMNGAGEFEHVGFSYEIDATNSKMFMPSLVGIGGQTFQQVSLTSAQRAMIRDVVRQTGLSPLLKDATLIFIPGQQAHYSLGRGNQLYFSLEDLNDRDLFAAKLRHELTEQQDVLRGLTAAERQLVFATRFNPEGRPAALKEKIRNLAIGSHLRLLGTELGELKSLVSVAQGNNDWKQVANGFVQISYRINSLGYQSKSLSRGQNASVDRLLVEKSHMAREVSGILMGRYWGDDSQGVLSGLQQQSDQALDEFLKWQIKSGDTTEDKAAAKLKNTRKFLGQWMDFKNHLPRHIVQGVLRGMLEGRSADILFSYSDGWRKFGVAGIRNPAVVQSPFKAIMQLELDEFARDPFAPIVSGPNMINAVTLLQQEASIVTILRDLQAKIAAGDPSVATLDPEFKARVMNNLVTIAYDSRLNGEYFAQTLAAAFLRDKVKIDLFDKAAGVPHLAWASNREMAAFGILISASHSEAECNGFKCFLGHQMSQVDNENKNRILKAREKVSYDSMNLDLAERGVDFAPLFTSTGTLRWVGKDTPRPGKNYYGRPLVSFYAWYYDLVKKRSPLALLPDAVRAKIEDLKKTNPLKILYTAFFGVGAETAADFRGFLRDEAGYQEVDIVRSQTADMNGRFPGLRVPDPGIIEGWIGALFDYIVQNAESDLSNIDNAIARLNEKDFSGATDPDIDRAAMVFSLDKGIKGNIKDALIARVARHMDEAGDAAFTPERKQQILAALRSRLNDKMLITANDAWTFMAYWKLKLMEENGQLEKDRVYVILKSDVTTPALERVAQLYRDKKGPDGKGYMVYVVDTYVGFTELGKKGRDLFSIAKESWNIYSMPRESLGGALGELVRSLKKKDAELKSRVPYQTAGLPILTETIALLNEAIAGDTSRLASALDNLNALSRMHVLMGVEESNGYGELGRWNREAQIVELNHISDKDGSLAEYEFLELLMYGRYVGKTGYQMFQEVNEATGMVFTVNSMLVHPGLTGVDDKVNEIEGLEKFLAYALQKALDQGQSPTLFNGRYTVYKVEIFRDFKFDDVYLRFPEEGIRFYLKNKEGSDIWVTYRPSGTGDSNRAYQWILGVKPPEGTDFEQYRGDLERQMAEVVHYFFGEEGRDEGYVTLNNDQFHGLLIGLKEGKLSGQMAVFGKALGLQGALALTETEQRLVDAVKRYAFAARLKGDDQEKIATTRRENRAAWEAYLASPEVVALPGKLDFTIDGKVVARIPRAAMIAWQGGVIDYLTGLLEAQPAAVNASFPDAEVADILRQTKPEIVITLQAPQPKIPPRNGPDNGDDGGVGMTAPSGPSAPDSPSGTRAPGAVAGIDLRYIKMTSQPQLQTLKATFKMPELENLRNINLESEGAQLKHLIGVGIIPSSLRLIEYVSACYLRNPGQQEARDAYACVVEYFRLTEDAVLESAPEMKAFLSIIESDAVAM